MHSHHSHSGQYCQHAKNTLEEMVLRAIARGLKLLCLTEHMPRIRENHLYPEELASQTTTKDLADTFDAYFQHALSLQAKYAPQIEILVGFEGEGIGPEYLRLMQQINARYNPDMFIGSVHHLGDIPIDYDQGLWDQALASVGSLEKMYETYFTQLHEVIVQLKPRVLAHLDLIRLFSPPFDLENSPLWALVKKVVEAGVREDCLFELNSAALRKGWQEPYPQRDIAQLILASGGKFCLSDDSHNVDQVALNYPRVFNYLTKLDVDTIYRLGRVDDKIVSIPVSVDEFGRWVNETSVREVSKNSFK